jgi:hypothetical protein
MYCLPVTDRLLRHVRTVLVLALLGAGPAARLADLLLYHTRAAVPTSVAQVDDGSAALPHGDACQLAVASAPATPAMACPPTLGGAPVSDLPEVPPADGWVVLRATGPPPSRGPPA